MPTVKKIWLVIFSASNQVTASSSVQPASRMATAFSTTMDSVTVAAVLSMTSILASGKSSSTSSRALRALPTQPLILLVKQMQSTGRPASAWARKAVSKSSSEGRLVLG